MKKSIHELTPEDFRVRPLWQPIDDLEDPNLEVTPYEGDLFLEEIYLVATNFKLADESMYDGYIRLSWGKPREIALAISGKEFCFFAVGIKDESGKWHKEFADKLNKKVDDVFPLEFRTSVKVSLRGEAI